MSHNILIEGEPGIGKTTVIERVLAALGPGAAGFTTGEIRSGGKRTGFRISSLDGREGILAQVESTGRPRVGKYVVDLSDLESIGVAALERGLVSARLIVIDEIGKMELFSGRFRQITLECLDSPTPLLATIRLKPDSFTDAIKSRADVTLVRVTRENRDELPEKLMSMIAAIDDSIA